MPSVMTDWTWVWPALVVAGLLVNGYVAVRLLVGGGWSTHAASTRSDRSAARRILDERFARGEIGEDEYRHRRRILP
jgi:putative membrane protein